MSYTMMTGALKYKDGEGTVHTYDGLKGEAGATPTLAIGTVTTLPAGSQATASVTGTAPNLTLNLGIPQGEAGTSGIVYSATQPSNPTTGMIWLQPVT